VGWDRGLVTPLRVRAALIGLGSILIGLTIFEMYLWWVVRSFIEISFIAGIIISLPAAGVLVVGGYRLPRTSVTERYYPRLLAWTSAGTAVLGGFSVITGVTFFPEMFWAQVGSVRSGVSVGSGTGFLIGFLIARGVEQRVAAERAAVRAEEAEDKQELLEYLNALLRHEVLNTANAINGHATLLESKLDENATQREHTEVIKRQTEEVSSVISDVQLLLESTEEDPDLEPVDLRPMLETELRNIRDRNGSVETEFDGPSEIRVMADHLTRRVFSNLLRNAVKHNDSEQKRVSVSVTETDETVTVEIEDNGPGIPEEEQDGIFDPEIRKRANHGLGLTIVARLVDRYGGDVDLVETGAEGTVFAVVFPTPPADIEASREAGSESRDRAEVRRHPS
jgi:two-component system OmpR family sensor kinase